MGRATCGQLTGSESVGGGGDPASADNTLGEELK